MGPRGFEPPTKPLYPDVSGAYASHRLPIIARYFLECRTIGIGLRVNLIVVLAGRETQELGPAAIAGIGDTAIEDVADERLHLRNDRGERVPVIGIAGQCCGMGGKAESDDSSSRTVPVIAFLVHTEHHRGSDDAGVTPVLRRAP